MRIQIDSNPTSFLSSYDVRRKEGENNPLRIQIMQARYPFVDAMLNSCVGPGFRLRLRTSGPSRTATCTIYLHIGAGLYQDRSPPSL